MIDFEAVNAAALAIWPELLQEWLPAGKRHGNEWVLGDFSGAPGRSLSINLRHAKWSDFSAGTKGGDPISVAAHAFHGGDRVAAARDLSRRLGIDTSGPVPDRVTPATPTPAEPEFVSSAPPPDADLPDMRGFDHIHVYRDAAGEPVRFICRRDARDGGRKVFVPVTWGSLNGGEPGWHRKQATGMRGLYGLDVLASMPGRTVIVVEGERTCDAAQAMFPDYPVVTWSGGSSTAAANDWTPLAGRRCVLFPDNDAPGLKAMETIRGIIAPAALAVDVLRVDDLEPGADAADLELSDPVAWLLARIGTRAVSTIDEPPPAEYDGPDHDGEYHAPVPVAAAPASAPAAETIVPLGYDRAVYFYLSTATQQVEAIPAAQHSRPMLCHLASEVYYWQRTRFAGEKSIDWNAAADDLRVKCRAMGIYDPDRVRGRGAWIDDGRAVLHMGDKLIVDGEASPLMLPGSKYVYEAKTKLTKQTAEPLPTATANQLVDICHGPTWQHGISGMLLAGFLVVAPICGGLRWRPSIWITGGAGSGKSWLQDNILRPAMGGVVLLVQGETTAAGIRHELGCDAIPVLFDEAERESANSSATMQGVLSLVRQSSSEGGGQVLKGTQSQAGAKKYHIRSCFAMSSINVGIEHQADESRITTLSLRERSPAEAARDQDKFEALNRKTTETITPAFAAGLLARSVRLLPVIRENAEVFAKVVAVVFGSRRAGDQIGALLAGAYSLHSDRVISPEAAEAFVRRQEWGVATRSDVDRDERQLINHIIQHRIRVTSSNQGAIDASIGRLVMAAADDDSAISAHAAHETLCEHGIRFDRVNGERGIHISTNHKALKAMMVGTPWSASWTNALGRLPGADVSLKKTVRFGKLHIGKAAWVPLATIDGGADIA